MALFSGKNKAGHWTPVESVCHGLGPGCAGAGIDSGAAGGFGVAAGWSSRGKFSAVEAGVDVVDSGRAAGVDAGC